MNTPTATVTSLEIAQPPAKESLLKVLDLLRDEVERGEIMSLVALTVRPGGQFNITSAGQTAMATMAGMLGRAQLDVLEAMRGTGPRFLR